MGSVPYGSIKSLCSLCNKWKFIGHFRDLDFYEIARQKKNGTYTQEYDFTCQICYKRIS